MNIVLSPFQNPFINLAVEDYFLRFSAHLPILFLYVNRPCVVMGRFQNPWVETNLKYLVENDIWLVRRQSGGGCVYHDEGNLNFSFITPEPMIDRLKHVKLLQLNVVLLLYVFLLLQKLDYFIILSFSIS